jgi:hypothetical protein
MGVILRGGGFQDCRVSRSERFRQCRVLRRITGVPRRLGKIGDYVVKAHDLVNRHFGTGALEVELVEQFADAVGYLFFVHVSLSFVALRAAIIRVRRVHDATVSPVRAAAAAKSLRSSSDKRRVVAVRAVMPVSQRRLRTSSGR